MSETNSGMTNPVETFVRVPWPEDKLPLKLKNPKCPICGGALFITGVNACEQEDNGDWIASEIDIDCENEPDIDSDDWEDWHKWHYSQPYIDWLPIDRQILRAVQKRYYFAP